MNKDTIWIVDDDRSIRWVLEKSFSKAGLSSESFDMATACSTGCARGSRP